MKFYIVFFLYLACSHFDVLAQPAAFSGQKTQKIYDALFADIKTDTAAALTGKIYDQILRLQNVSIDREIMLRQKLQYADAETLQLFRTKDSLLTRIAREYERPPDQRKEVSDLERKATEIENTILTRVQRGHQYFMALSVKFAREVYKNDPSLKCLSCYFKIKLQKGNQDLADQLHNYAAAKERSTIRWQQVQSELANSEAAIEFVSYQDTSTHAVHYGALLLRRDYRTPRYVPLCTQSELDEVLQKGGLDEVFYQQNLYSPVLNTDFATLYELIWAPLEPFLKNAKKIYYAPSGDLHRLNIAALRARENMPFLQDRYEFIRINSTRSLINPAVITTDQQTALPAIQLPCLMKTPVKRDLTARFFGNVEVDYYDPNIFSNNKNAALFGNIDYDMDSVALRNPGASMKAPGPKAAPSGLPRKRQMNKNATWDFLYGTKTEIDAIQTKLAKSAYTTTVFEGYAASEEAFKLLGKKGASPRIIHIATHGFFLADTAQQNADNPMNRSGLILAGANHAWKKGMPLKGMEDGILSAFEISIMNLQNTELVVLSACETGLGYIVNNEGVFGLQRAFKQAGVKNLMVSLWSIPDNATQILMTQFYQNCLEQDMPMRDALKAAQQWMRNQEEYKNPYYWAGFVLLE
jgi:CHAT domain-containing protein